MQRIYICGETAIFRMGNDGFEYPCIIDNVITEKKVSGNGAITLVYYDIDVIYDKDRGLHEIFKHIHSAFVHKISNTTAGISAYFYTAKKSGTGLWQVFRQADQAHIADIDGDCIFFRNEQVAYGPEDLTEIMLLMKQMVVPA